jgi:hypothetical protein
MGVRGFNALQIILASGFTHVTDLGNIPADVERLASLPEPVSLVRADESVNFKLAAKASDPIRRDTTIYSGLVQVIPSAVTAPDYFLVGSRQGTFQLIKRVAPPEKHPSLMFIRLPIKFVGSGNSKSGGPELWLSTVVLHTEGSVAPYLRNSTLVAA